MKDNKMLATSVASLALLSSAAHGITVLSDTFDDGDLAANTNGTGTGFTVTEIGTSGSASETGGNLSFAVNGGSSREVVISNDSFDLTGGFILSFDYSILTGGDPSNTFNVGLVADIEAERALIVSDNT